MSNCPRCQCDTTGNPEIYCSWNCEHLENIGRIAKAIRSLFGMGCDGFHCFSYLRDKGYLAEMSDSTVGRFKRVLMGDEMKEEPVITINGTLVTSAMSMTIRCAINNFALDLKSNGLGDDNLGKDMTSLYLERIKEINQLILTGE